MSLAPRFELWFWPTPNARKVSVMLEECGLDYAVHVVNLRVGEQLTPEFLALNPNNKIPILRDNAPPDGGAPLVLRESGAILLYLAEATGRFLPEDPRGRAAAREWLMFQMAGVGPNQGQATHFTHYAADDHPYARARYVNECWRLYSVADGRLAEAPFLAGEALSVADFALYPWVAQIGRIGLDLAEYPAMARWYAGLGERPALARGMRVHEDLTAPSFMTEAERDVMFGARQYRGRV